MAKLPTGGICTTKAKFRAWIIQNNELYCKPDTFTVEHGDLVTDKEYQNFDLRFEWKITVGGNSGVFL
jgi:hypothetical protein